MNQMIIYKQCVVFPQVVLCIILNSVLQTKMEGIRKEVDISLWY